MVQGFSEEQKRIAVSLLHGPKTSEELNKQLNIAFNELNKELNAMLKLKVITKSGYPLRYSLKPEIEKEVRRRKDLSEEDDFRLRVRAIVDVQTIEEALAKKSLDEVEKALRKDKDFTIYDITKAEPIQQGEHFTSYMEADLSVKDFKALVKLMYFYGPTTIEVIWPKKLELSLDDLQEGLMEMAEMIQAYNYHILKMMSKKELEDFQKKLFS